MFKSETSTSYFVRLDCAKASETYPTAVTAKPRFVSIGGRVKRIPSSSSTNKIRLDLVSLATYTPASKRYTGLLPIYHVTTLIVCTRAQSGCVALTQK